MPAEPLYPLRFEPILKSLIWGGRRLGTVLDKPIGDGDRLRRELGDRRPPRRRQPGRRRPARRARASATWSATAATSCSGRASRPGASQFPLLVKFLDAHQVLSVQVHPDDDLGRRLADDNGKTEAWVIVHAEPGSLIYAGLRPGVTRDDFAAAMDAGRRSSRCCTGSRPGRATA